MSNDAQAPYGLGLTEQAPITGRLDEHQVLEDFVTELNATAIRLRRKEDEADLPPGGAAILQLLNARGALTVPKIASARGTSRQNIQMVVNRLARKGWVELRPNPAHKRSPLVGNTEKGDALIPGTRKGTERLLQRLKSSISPRELQASAELLRRVRLALSGGRASAATDGEIRPRAEGRREGKRRSSTKRMVEANQPREQGAEETDLPVNLL